ncbi:MULTISPECIES: oligoendopeptidase F [Bacillaceae]|uniref:Oligopeptidase F n=1 Tax=Gottfriedia luciferensis TaxID=178774 RepID=A0ABX2ZUL5_9BACI|nr:MULTISPECIES: oligoendopeptidase F [Bacillaceae]ODG93500.1 oligoendopeptidase F [Gottfriedia luciferensis]PGZ93416.1 oligoendopeptidase F [Bacillus sp. AFS029533]
MEKMLVKRLTRAEVPTEMTWKLEDLFPTRAEWLVALELIENDLVEAKSLKGSVLKSAESLKKALLTYESIMLQLIRCGTYVSLLQSGDGSDSQNQSDSLQFSSLSTKANTTLTFIQSELLHLNNEMLEGFIKEENEIEVFKLLLEEIIASKKHILLPETEEALAALGEVTSAPYRIYQTSKAADLKFDSFEDENGKELENSFAMFENLYEFSPNQTVRKQAYESFTKTLTQYKNTYASIYATQVKKEVALSKLRNYDSVTQMLLEDHKVSLEMYHNQLNIIFKELAPHMRRLANLKKKQLGLETIHFYDLKAPLDPDFNPSTTYEEAKETILKSLEIMGPDYVSIMEKAFDERWIDYSDNVGKSTGAFCSSPYGVHPYILISWQDTMRNAFVLAHELGHAGHFYYANKYQRVVNTRPSMYFVEAPSTFNEMLLGQYLLKQTNDPKMKRWVILQLLGTYYHNFVTHLLEGEFQRRVYDLSEKGTPLTAKTFCEVKGNVLKEFWGDSVEIDEGASLTWMRQPHYYMGLYPYTYSAGLTASTAISRRIASEGQPVIDSWIEVLKTGGSKKPVELLKMAGVDLTTSAPIKEAVEYVGSLVTELESLF